MVAMRNGLGIAISGLLGVCTATESLSSDLREDAVVCLGALFRWVPVQQSGKIEIDQLGSNRGIRGEPRVFLKFLPGVISGFLISQLFFETSSFSSRSCPCALLWYHFSILEYLRQDWLESQGKPVV